MLDGDLPSIGGPDPGVHRPKPTSPKYTAHSVVLLKAWFWIVPIDPSPSVQGCSPASLVDRVIFRLTRSNRCHSIGISDFNLQGLFWSLLLSLYKRFGLLSFAHRGHILLPWQPLRRLTHSSVSNRGSLCRSQRRPRWAAFALHPWRAGPRDFPGCCCCCTVKVPSLSLKPGIAHYSWTTSAFFWNFLGTISVLVMVLCSVKVSPVPLMLRRARYSWCPFLLLLGGTFGGTLPGQIPIIVTQARNSSQFLDHHLWVLWGSF